MTQHYLYGYARKSPDRHRVRKTNGQFADALSIDRQAFEIKHAATTDPEFGAWTYVDAWPDHFVDDDTSGRAVPWRSRKGFQALLARLGPGDLVLVTNYDRVERGGVKRTLDAIEYIERLGARIISLHPLQRFAGSMDAPTREFLIAISAYVGEMYVKAISQKTQAAHRYLLSQGCKVTAYPPVGHRWVPTSVVGKYGPRCVASPIRRLCVVLVHRLYVPYKRGKSAQAIGEELDRDGIPYRPPPAPEHLRRWTRRDPCGRRRFQRVTRTVELIDAALAEGKTDWGGVPIPDLRKK